MTAAEMALERILNATATVEPDFSLETLYLTLQAVTAIAEEGLGRRCRPEMDSVAWSLPQALSMRGGAKLTPEPNLQPMAV